MAKWLGFIDNSGASRPHYGAGSVGDVVSHLPGVRAAVRTEAQKIGTIADLLLDTRPQQRTGASDVYVTQGELDQYVVLQDNTPGASPEERKAAAAGIEMQHRVLHDALAQRFRR